MKVLTLLILLLTILPMVNADLGTFKQNQCVDIKTILNATSVNISTLSYPNSTVALSNVEMTKIGQTFNYSFCNTQPLGIYIYDYFDSDGNLYVNNFKINMQGKDYGSADGLVYIAIFITLLGAFGFFTYMYMETPNDNPRGFENEIIAVDRNKYLKLLMFALAHVTFIAISYFAWNISDGILEFVELGRFFQVMFMISGWLIVVSLPIIFVFGIMYYVQDQKILDQIKRGVDIYG